MYNPYPLFNILRPWRSGMNIFLLWINYPWNSIPGIRWWYWRASCRDREMSRMWWMDCVLVGRIGTDVIGAGLDDSNDVVGWIDDGTDVVVGFVMALIWMEGLGDGTDVVDGFVMVLIWMEGMGYGTDMMDGGIGRWYSCDGWRDWVMVLIWGMDWVMVLMW